MPAIMYPNGITPRIITHYRDFLAHKLEAYAPGSKVIRPEWHGFICNAGAAYLKNGKIARIVVDAVSAGDGTSEDEWVKLPEGHFALGWWIPPATIHHADSGDLYGLVDDNGWPMTTLRYTDHPFGGPTARNRRVFS